MMLSYERLMGEGMSEEYEGVLAKPVRRAWVVGCEGFGF